MKALKPLVKPVVLPVIEWVKARFRQRELRAGLPHQGAQAIVTALDRIVQLLFGGRVGQVELLLENVDAQHYLEVFGRSPVAGPGHFGAASPHSSLHDTIRSSSSRIFSRRLVLACFSKPLPNLNCLLIAYLYTVRITVRSGRGLMSRLVSLISSRLRMSIFPPHFLHPK